MDGTNYLSIFDKLSLKCRICVSNSEQLRWRISEVNALVGLIQLRRIKEFIEARRRIALFYDKNLSRIKHVRKLELPPNLTSNYYKYIALLDPAINRGRLKKMLRERYKVSLSGEVYEIPCHRQPIFQNHFAGGPFPLAEEICKRHICLPIFATMTLREAEYVLDSLSKEIREETL